MTITLSEVARLVEGQPVGPESLPIEGAATLTCARPGEITLADSSRLAAQLARSQASAVIVGAGFQPAGLPYIVVRDVHAAFAKIVQHFRPRRPPRNLGISPHAQIAASARLSTGVQIHPLATLADDVTIGPRSIIHSGVRLLEGCQIGADVTIFPNAVLYENTIVGDRTIIHAGVILGAYGFGYSLVGGKHQLSHQLGHVEIGSDVEIGSASTVDRGTYGPTIIGDGTKIDNHVMVGHNVRIGRHNLICSQAGLAGSASTGDYVVIAGQVGVRDHVHIGDGAMLGGQSGVMADVPAGRRVVGSPAIDEKEQYHVWAATHKLPAMRKKMHELERQIAELASRLEAESAEHARDAA
ncbi:MAG: UDP-3-O-(3-hydroxymyristoyl)glucosamine N-acyltransferase [Pirellulaceae bacterium]|jgi:UDP-3-O-[3-hydroxymyristoyl] glucosamine N-acyltransferase|nr:UDP-3-O-(3-hydroxymyristoyl)glucosamine N-acyltransferase [Pirellulaceae bacterium]